MIWNQLAWSDVIGSTGSLLAAQSQAKYPAANPDFKGWKAPAEFGELKKTFRGSRPEFVIHIQDAHANEEAQRNIAEILKLIIQKRHVKLVAVEGGRGELFTDLFSFFPDSDVRKDIAEYYLKEGRLTGAEYLAMTEKPPLKIFGAENSALYEENRRAYLEVFDCRKNNFEALHNFEALLFALASSLFPLQAKEFLKRRQKFDEKDNDFQDYVRFLLKNAAAEKISLERYSGFQILESSWKLEPRIRFQEVESMMGRLPEVFKKHLPPEFYAEFSQKAGDFDSGRLQRQAYYRYLTQVIEKFPDIFGGSKGERIQILLYLRYVERSAEAASLLFEEIPAMERELRSHWFQSPQQKELEGLFRILESLKKGFEIAWTKEDAEYFSQNRGKFNAEALEISLTALNSRLAGRASGFSDLFKDFEKVESFYHFAVRRDRALIINALKKLSEEGGKTLVIITGGFHSPGIENYLKENNYSYAVIQPRIRETVDSDEQTRKYENALREKPLPLESFFSASFNRPLISKDSTLRFQLNARLMTPEKDSWMRVFQDASRPETVSAFSQLVYWTRFKHGRSKEGSEIFNAALPAGLSAEGTAFLKRRLEAIWNARYDASWGRESSRTMSPDVEALFVPETDEEETVIQRFVLDREVHLNSPWNRGRFHKNQPIRIGNYQVDVFLQVPNYLTDRGLKIPIVKKRARASSSETASRFGIQGGVLPRSEVRSQEILPKTESAEKRVGLPADADTQPGNGKPLPKTEMPAAEEIVAPHPIEASPSEVAKKSSERQVSPPRAIAFKTLTALGWSGILLSALYFLWNYSAMLPGILPVLVPVVLTAWALAAVVLFSGRYAGQNVRQMGALFLGSAMVFFGHAILTGGWTALWQSLPFFAGSILIAFSADFLGVFSSKTFFPSGVRESFEERRAASFRWAMPYSLIAGFFFFAVYFPFLKTAFAGKDAAITFALGLASWFTIIPLEIFLGVMVGEGKQLVPASTGTSLLQRIREGGQEMLRFFPFFFLFYFPTTWYVWDISEDSFSIKLGLAALDFIWIAFFQGLAERLIRRPAQGAGPVDKALPGAKLREDMNSQELFSIYNAITVEKRREIEGVLNFGRPFEVFSLTGNRDEADSNLALWPDRLGIPHDDRKIMLAMRLETSEGKTEFRLVIASGAKIRETFSLLWKGPIMPGSNYEAYDFILDLSQYEFQGRRGFHLANISMTPKLRGSGTTKELFKNAVELLSRKYPGDLFTTVTTENVLPKWIETMLQGQPVEQSKDWDLIRFIEEGDYRFSEKYQPSWKAWIGKLPERRSEVRSASESKKGALAARPVNADATREAPAASLADSWTPGGLLESFFSSAPSPMSKIYRDAKVLGWDAARSQGRVPKAAWGRHQTLAWMMIYAMNADPARLDFEKKRALSSAPDLKWDDFFEAVRKYQISDKDSGATNIFLDSLIAFAVKSKLFKDTDLSKERIHDGLWHPQSGILRNLARLKKLNDETLSKSSKALETFPVLGNTIPTLDRYPYERALFKMAFQNPALGMSKFLSPGALVGGDVPILVKSLPDSGNMTKIRVFQFLIGGKKFTLRTYVLNGRVLAHADWILKPVPPKPKTGRSRVDIEREIEQLLSEAERDPGSVRPEHFSRLDQLQTMSALAMRSEVRTAPEQVSATEAAARELRDATDQKARQLQRLFEAYKSGLPARIRQESRDRAMPLLQDNPAGLDVSVILAKTQEIYLAEIQRLAQFSFFAAARQQVLEAVAAQSAGLLSLKAVHQIRKGIEAKVSAIRLRIAGMSQENQYPELESELTGFGSKLDLARGAVKAEPGSEEDQMLQTLLARWTETDIENLRSLHAVRKEILAQQKKLNGLFSRLASIAAQTAVSADELIVAYGLGTQIELVISKIPAEDRDAALQSAIQHFPEVRTSIEAMYLKGLRTRFRQGSLDSALPMLQENPDSLNAAEVLERTKSIYLAETQRIRHSPVFEAARQQVLEEAENQRSVLLNFKIVYQMKKTMENESGVFRARIAGMNQENLYPDFEGELADFLRKLNELRGTIQAEPESGEVQMFDGLLNQWRGTTAEELRRLYGSRKEILARQKQLSALLTRLAAAAEQPVLSADGLIAMYGLKTEIEEAILRLPAESRDEAIQSAIDHFPRTMTVLEAAYLKGLRDRIRQTIRDQADPLIQADPAGLKISDVLEKNQALYLTEAERLRSFSIFNTARQQVLAAVESQRGRLSRLKAVFQIQKDVEDKAAEMRAVLAGMTLDHPLPDLEGELASFWRKINQAGDAVRAETGSEERRLLEIVLSRWAGTISEELRELYNSRREALLLQRKLRGLFTRFDSLSAQTALSADELIAAYGIGTQIEAAIRKLTPENQDAPLREKIAGFPIEKASLEGLYLKGLTARFEGVSGELARLAEKLENPGEEKIDELYGKELKRILGALTAEVKKLKGYAVYSQADVTASRILKGAEMMRVRGLFSESIRPERLFYGQQASVTSDSGLTAELPEVSEGETGKSAAEKISQASEAEATAREIIEAAELEIRRTAHFFEEYKNNLPGRIREESRRQAEPLLQSHPERLDITVVLEATRTLYLAEIQRLRSFSFFNAAHQQVLEAVAGQRESLSRLKAVHQIQRDIENKAAAMRASIAGMTAENLFPDFESELAVFWTTLNQSRAAVRAEAGSDEDRLLQDTLQQWTAATAVSLRQLYTSRKDALDQQKKLGELFTRLAAFSGKTALSADELIAAYGIGTQMQAVIPRIPAENRSAALREQIENFPALLSALENVYLSGLRARFEGAGGEFAQLTGKLENPGEEKLDELYEKELKRILGVLTDEVKKLAGYAVYSRADQTAAGIIKGPELQTVRGLYDSLTHPAKLFEVPPALNPIDRGPAIENLLGFEPEGLQKVVPGPKHHPEIPEELVPLLPVTETSAGHDKILRQEPIEAPAAGALPTVGTSGAVGVGAVLAGMFNWLKGTFTRTKPAAVKQSNHTRRILEVEPLTDRNLLNATGMLNPLSAFDHETAPLHGEYRTEAEDHHPLSDSSAPVLMGNPILPGTAPASASLDTLLHGENRAETADHKPLSDVSTPVLTGSPMLTDTTPASVSLDSLFQDPAGWDSLHGIYVGPSADSQEHPAANQLLFSNPGMGFTSPLAAFVDANALAEAHQNPLNSHGSVLPDDSVSSLLKAALPAEIHLNSETVVTQKNGLIQSIEETYVLDGKTIVERTDFTYVPGVNDPSHESLTGKTFTRTEDGVLVFSETILPGQYQYDSAGRITGFQAVWNEKGQVFQVNGHYELDSDGRPVQLNLEIAGTSGVAHAKVTYEYQSDGMVKLQLFRENNPEPVWTRIVEIPDIRNHPVMMTHQTVFQHGNDKVTVTAHITTKNASGGGGGSNSGSALKSAGVSSGGGSALTQRAASVGGSGNNSGQGEKKTESPKVVSLLSGAGIDVPVLPDELFDQPPLEVPPGSVQDLPFPVPAANEVEAVPRAAIIDQALEEAAPLVPALPLNPVVWIPAERSPENTQEGGSKALLVAAWIGGGILAVILWFSLTKRIDERWGRKIISGTALLSISAAMVALAAALLSIYLYLPFSEMSPLALWSPEWGLNAKAAGPGFIKFFMIAGLIASESIFLISRFGFKTVAPLETHTGRDLADDDEEAARLSEAIEVHQDEDTGGLRNGDSYLMDEAEQEFLGENQEDERVPVVDVPVNLLVSAGKASNFKAVFKHKEIETVLKTVAVTGPLTPKIKSKISKVKRTLFHLLTQEGLNPENIQDAFRRHGMPLDEPGAVRILDGLRRIEAGRMEKKISVLPETLPVSSFDTKKENDGTIQGGDLEDPISAVLDQAIELVRTGGREKPAEETALRERFLAEQKKLREPGAGRSEVRSLDNLSQGMEAMEEAAKKIQAAGKLQELQSRLLRLQEKLAAELDAFMHDTREVHSGESIHGFDAGTLEAAAEKARGIYSEFKQIEKDLKESEEFRILRTSDSAAQAQQFVEDFKLRFAPVVERIRDLSLRLYEVGQSKLRDKEVLTTEGHPAPLEEMSHESDLSAINYDSDDAVEEDLPVINAGLEESRLDVAEQKVVHQELVFTPPVSEASPKGSNWRTPLNVLAVLGIGAVVAAGIVSVIGGSGVDRTNAPNGGAEQKQPLLPLPAAPPIKIVLPVDPVAPAADKQLKGRSAVTAYRKGDVTGFTIVTPISGSVEIPKEIKEAVNQKSSPKKGLQNAHMVFVKAGTPIARVTDAELDVQIKDLDRRIADRKTNYEKYRRALPPGIRDPGDFEGAGQAVFNLQIERALLEYRRRMLSDIVAPADGYILLDTLAAEGMAGEKSRICDFIPADRGSIQLRIPADSFVRQVAASDYNFQIKARNPEGKIVSAQVQRITVEPFAEGNPYVDLTLDLFFPLPFGGLPSHVEWSVNPRDMEDSPKYVKGKETVTYGRVMPRKRFEVSSPALAGRWLPDAEEMARVQRGDLLGHSDGADYFLKVVQETGDFLSNAVWWDRIHKELGAKKLAPTILGNDDYSKLIFTVRDTVSRVEMVKAMSKIGQSNAVHSGVYIPRPEVIRQPMKPGSPVGSIAAESAHVTDIEILRNPDGSLPVGLGDVVIIQTPSGEFLGQVLGIEPFAKNKTGSDRSNYGVITDLYVPYDPNWVLGDNRLVRIRIPDRADQPRLKEDLSKAQVPGRKTATEILYRGGKMPAVLEEQMLDVSRADKKIAARDPGYFLHLTLQHSISHERIAAAEYLIAQLNQGDSNFQGFLKEMVFQSLNPALPYREDVAELALREMRNKKQILELMEILDKTRRSPRTAFAARLAGHYVHELLISDPSVLVLAVEQSRMAAGFREISQNFFLSLAVERTRAGDLNHPVLIRALRSDMWTDQELAVLSGMQGIPPEARNFFELEIQRRIAVREVRNARFGFLGSSMKNSLGSLAIYPHLRDKIRRTEYMTFGADLLFLTSSPFWYDPQAPISPAVRKTVADNFSALKTDNAFANPPAVEIYDLPGRVASMPVFASSDFAGRKVQIDMMHKEKRYEDMIALLAISEYFPQHGGYVIDLLTEHEEGRYLLAVLYGSANLKTQAPLLERLENTREFFPRVTRDLGGLREKERKYEEDDSGTPEKRLKGSLADITAQRDAYLKSLARLYSRIQGPDAEQGRAATLATIMRTLVASDQELAAVTRYDASSAEAVPPLFQLLKTAGVPADKIKAAAADQLDRRAWLFSIQLAREKYGFNVDFLRMPGLPDQALEDLDQMQRSTQFDQISFKDRLDEARRNKQISDKAFAMIVENHDQMMADFAHNDRPAVTHGEAFYYLSWTLRWVAALIGTIYSFVFIYLGIYRFLMPYWLRKKGVSIKTIRAEADALLKNENIEPMGGNLVRWDELVKKEGKLEGVDYTNILNFAAQNLKAGRNLPTPDDKDHFEFDMDEMIKKMDEKGLSNRLDYLWIVEKLIQISLERMRYEAKLMLEALPGKLGDEKQAAILEIRRTILSMDRLVKIGTAINMLVKVLSRARGLKLNYRYHVTLLTHQGTVGGGIAWLLNRFFWWWFMMLRVPLLLTISGLLMKSSIKKSYSAFVDYVNSHLERGLYSEESNEGVDKAVGPGFMEVLWLLVTFRWASLWSDTSTFIKRDTARGKILFGHPNEFWDLLTRSLFLMGLFFPLLLLSPAFLGVGLVVNLYAAPIFSVGAGFLALGWWRYWGPMFHNWHIHGYAESGIKLNFFNSVTESLLSELSRQTGQAYPLASSDGLDPLIALDHEAVLNARRHELSDPEGGSADFIIFVHRDAADPKKKAAIERMILRHVAKKTDGSPAIPVLVIPNELSGSGGAYLTAERYLTETYEGLRARYPRLPKDFQKSRGIYLTPEDDYLTPLSLFLGVNNRPSMVLTDGGQDISTLEYLLLKGYQATQILEETPEVSNGSIRRQGRGGKYIVSKPNMLYLGPLSFQGHVTRIGAFKSLDKVLEEDADILDNPWQSELQAFLRLPSRQTIFSHIKDRDRLRRYIDPRNESARQYAADTGITLVSFSSGERMEHAAYLRQMAALYERAAGLHQVHGSDFSVSMEEIVVGTLLAEQAFHGGDFAEIENQEDTSGRKFLYKRKNPSGFLEVRTRGMPPKLASAYRSLYGTFKTEAKKRRTTNRDVLMIFSQYTPHVSEGVAVDMSNQDVARDFLTAGGFFQIRDPSTLLKKWGLIADTQSGNLYAGVSVPGDLPKNLFVAHLQSNGVSAGTVKEEVTVFMGIHQNLLDVRNRRRKIFGKEITDVMSRLTDPDGRSYYSSEELERGLNPDQFAIFPRGPYDAAALKEWIELLMTDGEIRMPVTRAEWEAGHVSVEWILQNQGKLRAARSEIRREKKTAGKNTLENLTEIEDQLQRLVSHARGDGLPLQAEHVGGVLDLVRNESLRLSGEKVDVLSLGTEGEENVIAKVDRSIAELYYGTDGKIYRKMNQMLFESTKAKSLLRRSVRIFPLTRKGKLVLIQGFDPEKSKRLWHIPGGQVKAGAQYEDARDEELKHELGWSESRVLDSGRFEFLGHFFAAHPWEQKKTAGYLYRLDRTDTKETKQSKRKLERKLQELGARKFADYLTRKQSRDGVPTGLGEVWRIKMIPLKISKTLLHLLSDHGVQAALSLPTSRSEVRDASQTPTAKWLSADLEEANRIRFDTQYRGQILEWLHLQTNEEALIRGFRAEAYKIIAMKRPDFFASVSVKQGFDYILEYDPAKQSLDDLRRLSRRLPAGVQLVLVPGSARSIEERQRFYAELHQAFAGSWWQAGHPRILVPKFDGPDWKLESFIQDRMKHYHLSDQEVLWLKGAGMTAEWLNKKYLEPVYAATLDFAQHTLVVVSDSVKPGKSLELNFLELFAAARAVEQSS